MYCEQPLLQFEMMLLPPKVMAPYLARFDIALQEAHEIATGIDFTKPEHTIARQRSQLPRRCNGGGIRNQQQVSTAAWLGCACMVYPRMRDYRSADGQIVKGFMPHLRDVGETSADQEATRHARLIESRCLAGLLLTEGWTSLQQEAGNPEEGFFATSAQSLGFHDGQVVEKMQKKITKEREELKVAHVESLILQLRRDDPQRVSWRQMAKSGRSIIGSLPSRTQILGNRDFVESMHMFYGVANRAYAEHVGKPILQTGRLFDEMGLAICRVTMTGDGWRRGHNARERQLERFYKASGIDVRSEVDNLFLAYIDDKEGWGHLNGGKRRALIPDFLLTLQRILQDVKVLHWGPKYSGSDVAGGTTESRARQVHKDYFKKAQWIDEKFNNWTGVKFGGPVCVALREYGPIHGLVYSQHRVSSQVMDAIDACANSAAAGWAVDGARNRKEAKAAYKQGMIKAIGILNYREFSRLKFDRIDIMLGEGKGNAARNRADAAYECEVDLEYYLRHGPQGINAAGRAARRARRE